jgi:beta-lactamase regulating signal transducer with metallopeptidase domain
VISNILSESLIFATIGLVALPFLAHRVRRAFRPVELTRYNAFTTWTGVLLLLAALILCAIPTVLALSGAAVPDRHFFPGDAAVGWLSAAIATVLIWTMVVGLHRVRQTEQRLRIEPSVGTHYTVRDFDIVVLVSTHPMAYAVGGGQPQVVLTSGLLNALTLPEAVSVIQHEAAHIALHHRIHLISIGLIEPIGAWLYPVRRLVEVLRMALEHAADAGTTNGHATRSALLTLSRAPAVQGIAAFTAGDVLDRLSALGNDEPEAAAPLRTLMYSSAIGLAGLSIAILAVFWL